MTDRMSLEDRVVIVTGASRGIGAGVVRAALDEGASVVAVARGREALDAAWGAEERVRCVAGDVADTDAIIDALDAADDLGGHLWGLVNNAGINPYYHPITETPLAEWDDVMRVNLLGASAFSRACARVMIAQERGGRIVNLGSVAGLTGLPNIGPYNASKAALDAVTRTLAVELGPHDILVNTVAPGTVATEMVEDLFNANPALRERLVAKSPLGRIGTVGEAVGPIMFLLSDAASFITGHVLVVDGGRLAAG
ncbi:MAG: SDR family oxidoreductase [Propionibacteriaceae bacterium]|nr:SDR family oxidoreductase [Propionibacteriaceae bacterium]